MLYTDVCSITNITLTSEQLGETTENEVTGIKCREELNDQGTSGQSGDKKKYKRLYILPPGTLVEIGDLIKTTKRRGVTETSKYSKIDDVFTLGGYRPHHIEATVK